MNEKILKKLKDSKFFSEIVVMSDKEKVKDIFKSSGIEITDEDLKDMKEFIERALNVVSKLPDNELEAASGGLNDGLVCAIFGQLAGAAGFVHLFGSLDGGSPSCVNIARHSDKIVEGVLATTIAGVAVGGTIGVQKLVQKGREKGWWAKKK